MPDEDYGGALLPRITHPYNEMKESIAGSRPKAGMNKISLVQTLSYVFDWVILIIVGVIGVILGNVTPNKRPFSLQDPNISFPFTEHETVTSKLLIICNAVIPVVIILVVTLVFVPGPTVPPGTPKSMIWKRKLWELHMGWLGLALSLMCAWIITQGMKNLFGKPRPDLLTRCQPDLANWAAHVVGFHTPTDAGLNMADGPYNGQLVSATICQNTDRALLDDGFRSYPSGHSSSAAAGLIYTSLLLASKFAITIPFVPHSLATSDEGNASAFPSRMRNGTRAASRSNTQMAAEEEELTYSNDPKVARELSTHNTKVLAVRRQAAAPPIYLLVITVLPWFTSIFIASSRWFDFRHHGFDILFGYIIGTIVAWFSFRYYHLPISSGAGWAWGPRSHDKAFWAGVGSYSYATDRRPWTAPGDVEERFAPPLSSSVMPGGGPGLGAPVPLPRSRTTHSPDEDDAEDIEMRPQHGRPPRHPQEYEPMEYRGAAGRENSF